MIGRLRHLSDDRLHECYLAECLGDAVDLRVAEHLSDCEACGARYAELARFLGAVRAEGTEEADAHFTPERLHAQKEQVARRLAQTAHSARIIGFPGRVTQHIARASARVAPHWLAAAAAAGLFVGVGVGGALREPASDPTSMTSVLGRAPEPNAARVVTEPGVLVAPAPSASEAVDVERFLMELEVALEHQNTRELRPFDALMPRVREISADIP